jgi:gliding motility-associated-like protein
MIVTIIATDNTGGTDSKSFTVTNTNIGSVAPTANVTAANNTICEGEQASFHASVTNGDAGAQYQWQVNGVNAGINSPDFTSTVLRNNDVVNCIVTTGGGCGVPNVNSGITVLVNQKPTITLKSTEQILSGTGISLNPVVSGNITSYKWMPAEGLSDANSQYPLASPETTTTYKLTAITDQGCQNEASVTVEVIHQINIPNAFTPNADGYNDLWNVKYLNAYSKCIVNVYSRNGILVYHSNGYNIAWNGTSNGKSLPAGVYYYTIDLGNGSAILSGNVSIIR